MCLSGRQRISKKYRKVFKLCLFIEDNVEFSNEISKWDRLVCFYLRMVDHVEFELFILNSVQNIKTNKNK